MFQTLTNNWLLLALCGVFEAAIAAIFLSAWNPASPLAFHSWNSAVVLLGELALAAAVCTIAAGVFRSRQGKSWLLVLNGVALGALGLIGYAFTRYRIAFGTIAVLIVLMATSQGLIELQIAHGLQRRRRFADGWFCALSGAASLGFAAAFLGLGLRWIDLNPGSHADLLWLGSYFGFSALCMFGLALRLHSLGLTPPDRNRAFPMPGSPNHAH